jgi:hypothetical protein
MKQTPLGAGPGVDWASKNPRHSPPKGLKPKGYTRRRGTEIGLRPPGGGKEKKTKVPKQGKGLKKYPYGQQAVYRTLAKGSK